MRVGIDGHMLGSRESGNATYIAGLLQGLSEWGGDVCAFVQPAQIAQLPRKNGGVKYSPLGSSSDWARLAFDLARVCVRERIDLLHVTYHAPLYASCPFVVTIHDVAFKLSPEYFSPRDRLLLNWLVPLSARRSRAVITDSESARRDILKFYPFLQSKVFVVPLAAGNQFRPAPKAEQVSVCERYHIRPPFVLTLARLDPRKNLSRVIAAWRALGAGVDCRLVMGGDMGYRAAPLLNSIAPERESGEIVVTGFVPEHDLAALYSASAVFVYPSLYEGFGLPLLEAMACGVPVITSNCSSLPEVAGDAALQIDPNSTEALTSALREVLGDADLANDLKLRGLARAQNFTWRKTAQLTWQVYEQALANRVP